MTLPEHTSASQLALYSACPRKYRYRYLEDAEPEYRSVSLALGSVVHSVIAWWFDRRIEGTEPTMEDAMEILRADFAAATHEEIALGRWTLEDLQAHAGHLVRTFLQQLGDLDVQRTEMRFEVSLYDPDTGDALERPLVGYFDHVLGDGHVLELKTARSEYKPLALTTGLQFGAYLFGIERLWGNGELELAVIVKNKAPRIQRLKLHPNARTAAWFLRAATDIERSILAGHFPPAPGWSCGTCEYQRRCLGNVEDEPSDAKAQQVASRPAMAVS